MVYFIYDYFFPAYKAGGPIQSLVNLSTALAHTNQISIICSDEDLDNTKLNVVADSWQNVNDLPVFYSDKGFSHYSKNIQSSNNNLFFINGIFSLQYNFLPLLFLKGRKIVSVRGMLHPGALSQKSLKKKLYLMLWKILGLPGKIEFHATSTEEREFIHDNFGRQSKVWVISNLPRQMNTIPLPVKEKGSLRMGTIALIGPMKNHLLIIEALKNCTADIEYLIYGPVKDAEYWEKCKAGIQQLPANIKVTYHGDVSSDKIATVLSSFHLYVQPSKSENFGHSLFEAFASGRPVITSEYTPWNDLAPNKAGANIGIDNTASLTDVIDRFAAMENDELQDYSKGAQEYIKKHLDTQEITRQYKEMFDLV